MQNLICYPQAWIQGNLECTISFWNAVNIQALNSKEAQISILKQKIQQLSAENKELKEKLYHQSIKTKRIKKKNIIRRTENQLRKCHNCPYQKCKKQYASNLALNLHIKIKHDGGTKKQRDMIARRIIDCQQNGNQIPCFDLKLPPNFIANYKKQQESRKNGKNLKLQT